MTSSTGLDNGRGGTSPDQTPSAELRSYLRRLAAVLTTEPGIELVGTYLHGSAVLPGPAPGGGLLPGPAPGGLPPWAGDIEVLAVVARSTDAATQARLGATLQAAAIPCPGAGLEMSVITAATAADLGTCPFEVHLNARAGRSRINLGTGHPGDPDLVLRSESCRRDGVAVTGPPPAEIFGPVPRARLLRAVREELDNALERSQTSAAAILNACRALRFATEGVLSTKEDAGAWALHRDPDDEAVRIALSQRRDGIAVTPLPPAASRLVAEAHRALATA